jgi:hypothetical protein
MSGRSRSDDFLKTKWFPIICLVTGVVLLWFGNQEYQQFQESVADYVLARPENRTVWLLILGTAATAAGISGLLRDQKFL